MTIFAVTSLTSAVSAENISTSLSLEIESVVTNGTPTTDETFVYEITSNNSPLPTNTQTSISGTGTAYMSEIWFDTPGVYNYSLQQTQGQSSKYNYSTTQYNITVYVISDDSGVLDVAMVTASDDETGEKVPSLTFENEYIPDVIVIPVVTATPTPTITTTTDDPEIDYELPTYEEEEPEDDLIIIYPSDDETAVEPTPTPSSSSSSASTSTEEPEETGLFMEIFNLEEIPTITLFDNDVPLFAPDGTAAWALLNLILTILTAIGALLLIITLLIKKRKKKEDEEEEENNEEDEENAPTNTSQNIEEISSSTEIQEQREAEEKAKAEEEEEDEKQKVKKRLFFRVLSVLWAIITIIVFILTEDMTLPMAIMDKWTLLMFILFVLQILWMFFSRKKRVDKDEEDEEDEENTDDENNDQGTSDTENI